MNDPETDAEADAREAIYRRGIEACREALHNNQDETEEAA